MRKTLMVVAILLAVGGVIATACSAPPVAARAVTPPTTTPASLKPTTTTPTPTPTKEATPAPAPTPSTTATAEPESRCPPGGFPAPACTGVPPGTTLTKLPLDSDGDYRATTPGQVIDGKHIAGDLLIAANGVVVRNSRIDGAVINELDGARYPFTITDSTVGPAEGCLTSPGVGEAMFTATRVHVRGHGDGFRASGDDIRIEHSFVLLCSNPGDHSDGIQTYLTGTGLTVHHNTIDQRYAEHITAPIFLTDDGLGDVVVTDNLVMGGTYSIQVKNFAGTAVVQGNMLVDGSWVYGPVESDCGRIDWSGNKLVTIDEHYRVTSVVGPLPCMR